MKWISTIILLLLFIGLLFYGITKLGSKEKKLGFKSEVISVKDGFGYQILNADKILIKQDFIPAVQGKKPFMTAKDAKLIGELVVHKLSNGESPVIYLEEIESFNIEL